MIKTECSAGSAVCRLLCLTLLITVSCSHFAGAQSAYFSAGDKHLPFLDRLEIRLQKNPDMNLTSIKGLSRHMAVDIAGLQDSASGLASTIPLSRVDRHNLQSLLMNNAEWVTRENRDRIFYKNPANLIEVNNNKFFFVLNPLLQFQQSYEPDNDDRIHHYAAGASMRGLLANKIGFYGYLSKNMETPPTFAVDRINGMRAVPGAGEWEGYDRHVYHWLDARGGITFRALNHFDFQIAYDRNFIGNGYRSLFLSDNGSSNLFFKVNTRFWKVNYQHLYSALASQFPVEHRNGRFPFGRKLVAMHRLSLNVTKWLDIGAFQAIIINKQSDYPYLYPLMFLPISQITGKKPANDLAGIDFKANVAKRHQVYGQFLMDQFIFKDVTAGDGRWSNRFGVQIGSKTIDLFGINNLDLQVETNIVRPFTYASNDSASNYSHYNQQLAHPFGANFAEGIVILRYQPSAKLTASARAIYWQQGVDTGNVNFGGNIFKPYGSRAAEYGFTVPSGIAAKGLNAQLTISYEILENLFLDASALVRTWKSEEQNAFVKSTSMFTLGVRLNMFTREYDY